MSERTYDLVVFGATGFTGKLTAEYIATSLPTDLKWAIAGRSQSKLEGVAAECKKLNPDRIQPAIEVCSLNGEELDALAKKSTLLIATIGPYSIHGEAAFKACADNGTHYLDVTGEAVWVARMIKKYERTAKASGSIMIPQIGIDSAPADLVTWTICGMIREKYSAPTGEVVMAVTLDAKPSGGTMSTLLSLLDVIPLKELAAANAPYALSPIPGPKVESKVPRYTKVLGVRSVRDLGILTSYFFEAADRPLVQRTWGILGGPNNYGPNFQFNEYMKSRNYLTALATHFGLVFISLLVVVPFIRTLLKKQVVQPGDGPTKEQAKNDLVQFKGIGHPDVSTPKPGRAYCRALYHSGGLYELTGIIVSSAAMSVLKGTHKLSGGIYTPACLGQDLIDRLDSAGFKFEKKFYED
ncbi:Saccharopine dehydrogenase-domain-containing protein [Halenospora varia]|nr:Saccharopine dehydrogenase-domain-containing protein [Halenospora varia]